MHFRFGCYRNPTGNAGPTQPVPFELGRRESLQHLDIIKRRSGPNRLQFNGDAGAEHELETAFSPVLSGLHSKRGNQGRFPGGVVALRATP